MLSFDIEKALVFIEKIAMDSMKSMAVLCIKCHRSVAGQHCICPYSVVKW